MPNSYKFCIIGSGGVGKSCITLRFINDKFIDYYDPTIYDNYRKTYKTYLIELTDTAGQEDYKYILNQFILENEGYIIVYSVNSKGSFEEVEKYYTQICMIKENAKIVLVANKIDLENERTISKEMGEELAKKLNVPFIEVSALKNININEIIDLLIEEMKKHTEIVEPPKKGCCNLL